MNFYIIQFGGTRSGTLFEAHEVRTAFGMSIEHALDSVADLVRSGMAQCHTDGFAEIRLEDAAARQDEMLYLVETGSNGPAMFEQHGYEFVWARNAREAQSLMTRPAHRCHIDTVFNVSRAVGQAGYAVPRLGPDGQSHVPLQKPFYKRF
ncbi:MAG: hypothetical protein ACKOPO_10700 [Novosphingobium sp.]